MHQPLCSPRMMTTNQGRGQATESRNIFEKNATSLYLVTLPHHVGDFQGNYTIPAYAPTCDLPNR